MYNPVATYRVQFHKEFTFRNLERIIPYLQKLGIKTLYASPIFQSTPGSMHGYDGTDPTCIDPEIGTEEELRRISGRLRELGIGWLQDIVPNHMAFHSGNAWLMDVLEHGQASRYASFFDIDWNSGERLMVPFLGGSLDDVLQQGGLKVTQHDGRWMFDYSGNYFPINEASIHAMISGDDMDAAVERLNGDAEALRRLADAQHYRLCHWQETDQHINYRRFFTVNGLICLNVQDPEVCREVHAYAASLLHEGVFSGLRIDHVDGLYDPATYLNTLRELTGPECYTVVEKILEPGETLPTGWPIQGNTGYDFLSLVNNLFTRQRSEKVFTQFYRRQLQQRVSIQQQLYDKKAHILYQHMQGELENLTRLFLSSGLGTGDERLLRSAIGEFLIQCPVYRYYGNHMPLNEPEAAAVERILIGICHSRPELKPAIELLDSALLKAPLEHNAAYNRKAAHFYQRCMQFTGPLMAKGVEDTLMYTYNRFIGHNDVGDSPKTFGLSKGIFHRAMMDRQAIWPLTINTTSTHDTKRGEDARALVNVLTDLPAEWLSAASAWPQLNAALKANGTPDATDEYFIYQTLIATYPFEEAEQAAYPERLGAYLQKALREGKRRSDWASPDEAYEQAAINFALGLLDQNRPFWGTFCSFRQSVLDFGIIQSLAQLALKLTCPGVPDIYQGAELWDLSMVDPDNRRPVDFEARARWLDGLMSPNDRQGLQQQLWAERANGQIKLWLLHTLLRIRSADPELFAKGQYVPLRVTGRYHEHVFAFARRYDRRWIVVAVPLQTAALGENPLTIDWKDTAIVLPPQAPKDWSHLLENADGAANSDIPVQEIFRVLPLAILSMKHEANERGAGVFLPVSSLPSPYHIGDLGPEAMRFARLLNLANQRYWQLLPLNPVSAGAGFSPYSSISTMAGNPLLISPDQLVADGMLRNDDLRQFRRAVSSRVNYEAAERTKEALLDLAFERYKCGSPKSLKREVAEYSEQEAYWLDDFALYAAIKRHHEGKPWYEWPDELRHRDKEALMSFAQFHIREIEKVEWQQAMFSRQWQGLREYCRMLGIQLIGDLPFYASYDSADVWTHPEIFSVDEQGMMTGVAGVPPDYFSETGQLWGMPTFKWDVLKKQEYRWWIERLRKNLQLYDVLRIDHFRALAAYWEVPAGEETAVKGEWIKGPDTHFFESVKSAFGSLPFIAEDLGDNMRDVYRLRDEVGLPGMKVMQFAFGDNLPASVDAPHNYDRSCVVYTGTHDNNTTLGWFRKDTTKDDRRRLARYAGSDITEKNVNEVMASLAYGSVARIAILPMQDVLHLDEQARMNVPSSGSGNWRWRMKPGQLKNAHIGWLRELAGFYNRK